MRTAHRRIALLSGASISAIAGQVVWIDELRRDRSLWRYREKLVIGSPAAAPRILEL